MTDRNFVWAFDNSGIGKARPDLKALTTHEVLRPPSMHFGAWYEMASEICGILNAPVKPLPDENSPEDAWLFGVAEIRRFVESVNGPGFLQKRKWLADKTVALNNAFGIEKISEAPVEKRQAVLAEWAKIQERFFEKWGPDL